MPVTQVKVSAHTRSRLATQQRLVAGASSLFAARGLHGVTSHEIAHEAGVAAGTFYLHFKDKNDIYRKILTDTVKDLRERIQSAIAGTPDTASAARARASTIVSFAESNKDLVRILFSRDSEASDIEADVLAMMAEGLCVRLKHEQAEGRFSADLNPEITAQALLGMQAKVIDWWTEDSSRADRDDIVATLVRLELYGTQVGSVDTK